MMGRNFRFKSPFGGAMTLICGGVYLLFFLSSLYRYIVIGMPEIHSMRSYIQSTPEINMSNDNFPFSFGIITDAGNSIIDEEIFVPELRQISTQRIERENSSSFLVDQGDILPLKRCNYSSLKNQSSFKGIDSQGLYCLDDGYPSPLKLSMDTLNGDSKQVQVLIKKCNPLVQRSCKSDEDIKNIIDVADLIINYQNTHISLKGQDLVAHTDDSFRATLAYGYKKIVRVVVSQGCFNSDSSLLSFWNNTNPISFLQYKEHSIDFDNSRDDTVAVITISLSTSVLTTERVYMRIDQFLSEVGGYGFIVSALLAFMVLPVLKKMGAIEMARDVDERQSYLSKLEKEDMACLERLSEVGYTKEEMNASINQNKNLSRSKTAVFKASTPRRNTEDIAVDAEGVSSPILRKIPEVAGQAGVIARQSEPESNRRRRLGSFCEPSRELHHPASAHGVVRTFDFKKIQNNHEQYKAEQSWGDAQPASKGIASNHANSDQNVPFTPQLGGGHHHQRSNFFNLLRSSKEISSQGEGEPHLGSRNILKKSSELEMMMDEKSLKKIVLSPSKRKDDNSPHRQGGEIDGRDQLFAQGRLLDYIEDMVTDREEVSIRIPATCDTHKKPDNEERVKNIMPSTEDKILENNGNIEKSTVPHPAAINTQLSLPIENKNLSPITEKEEEEITPVGQGKLLIT